MTNPLPLTLYYINTAPLSTSPTPTLPLLSTLRPSDQTSITRFHRLQDRHMSLASTLLKYLFIHRTAQIPWSEIVISRTPAPHKRPFWDPATAPSHAANRRRPGAAKAVEFNVSHQAGLVALAGCATDTPPATVLTTTATTPDGDLLESSPPSDPGPGSGPGANSDASPPLIGIDITCPFEPGRGNPSRVTTPSQFEDWVDIFASVFSPAEVEEMKSYVPPPPPRSPPVGQAEAVAAKLRYFYTFWALKEAYIKMTGEALLAGWLRELEFRQVRVPAVAEEGRWGVVEAGVQVWMGGRRVEGLRVEVVGFGREYVVAMVGRGLDGYGDGGGDGKGQRGLLLGEGMEEIDIEGCLKDCAEGRCGCLDERNG